MFRVLQIMIKHGTRNTEHETQNTEHETLKLVNYVIYKKFVIAGMTLLWAVSLFSQVWNPNVDQDTYKNPVIFADYSDPDVIRDGDDFYMVASSFNCTPGLPVLHSKDLVNWEIVNHVYDRLPLEKFDPKREFLVCPLPVASEISGTFIYGHNQIELSSGAKRRKSRSGRDG